MTELTNDTRDKLLTPEFVGKSDQDIKTISSLNDIAQKWGVMFVLSGGYAVEALCGGKIVRPHGDVDGWFVLSGDVRSSELLADVKSVLQKEDIKWEVRKEDGERIELLEEAPEKEFFEKRRFEIKTRLEDEYSANVEDSVLVDSRGAAVSAKVVGLSDLVATKIHVFYVLRDGVDTNKDRHTSASDYFDLKRLLDLPRLDRVTVRNRAPEEFDAVVALVEQYQESPQ